MKIRKFEEIEAWQEERILTAKVYRLTKLQRFSKDWGLKDQIQRASVSMAMHAGRLLKFNAIYMWH